MTSAPPGLEITTRAQDSARSDRSTYGANSSPYVEPLPETRTGPCCRYGEVSDLVAGGSVCGTGDSETEARPRRTFHKSVVRRCLWVDRPSWSGSTGQRLSISGPRCDVQKFGVAAQPSAVVRPTRPGGWGRSASSQVRTVSWLGPQPSTCTLVALACQVSWSSTSMWALMTLLEKHRRSIRYRLCVCVESTATSTRNTAGQAAGPRTAFESIRPRSARSAG